MNSRRKFLQLASAAPLVAAGCANLRPTTSPQSRGGRKGPKKIIHMVADGMSSGTLSCGNHFSEYTRGRALSLVKLTRMPGAHQGFMDMRSQDSIVTDSSAASSVWGSGVRIPNGKVNQNSEGQKLVTLYELMQDAGWKRGLVTTTEITHATPAGFAACTASRDFADEIAAQYLERRVDVLMGGGHKFFKASSRKDKRDLFAEFKAAGYAVAQTPAELRVMGEQERAIGIFSESHIPYVIDVKGGRLKVTETPNLAEMTRAALNQLARHENFILQVEGGRVDHCCHAMDAAGAAHEMISFDEALDVCLSFQREHPETLIVITTDHGTGNPGLNGMGSEYRDSPRLFTNTTKIKMSIGELVKAVKKGKTPQEMAARLKEVTGYEASTKRMELLQPYIDEKGTPLYESYKSDTAALSQVLANYTGVSFTSGSHTSDLVPVISMGPSSEDFQGIIEGPHIFERYTDYAGIKFRNPAEALVRVAEAGGGRERVEEYWETLA